MKGNDIISEIKKAINEVKQKNQDVISVDALLNYLDFLERDISNSDELDHKQDEAKEPLNKSKNSLSRHSGVGQNPVKTIIYWMLVFTSMTVKRLNQSFLSSLPCRK